MIITQIIFSNNNGPRIPELTKDDSFFEKSLTQGRKLKLVYEKTTRAPQKSNTKKIGFMPRIKETPNFDFTSILPKTERSVQREQFWVYQ